MNKKRLIKELNLPYKIVSLRSKKDAIDMEWFIKRNEAIEKNKTNFNPWGDWVAAPVFSLMEGKYNQYRLGIVIIGIKSSKLQTVIVSMKDDLNEFIYYRKFDLIKTTNFILNKNILIALLLELKREIKYRRI
jgi:hypothetical protein